MKKLLSTMIIGTTLTYSSIYVYNFNNENKNSDEIDKIQDNNISTEIQIEDNLITFLTQKGELVADIGNKNLKTYILSRIEKNFIELDDVKVNFCGEEKTYILGVGIKDYKNTNGLNYAILDSKKMLEVFSKNS